MNFLDLNGLGQYTAKIKSLLSGFVPSTRTVNGKSLSSNITLTASDVSAVPSSRTVNGKALSSNITLTAANVSALPITGGTLTGDLRIKGTGNYGTKLNFGDSDYVHISEPTDDCMELKAKKVNFVLSDTTDAKFTINGANPFGAASGGGSIEVIQWAGSDNETFSLTYTTNKTPVGLRIVGNYTGPYSPSDVAGDLVFRDGTTSYNMISTAWSGGSTTPSKRTVSLELSASSKTLSFTNAGAFNTSINAYYAMLIF